jgi:Leucine-rich repeat (LRR) protein
MSDESSKSSTPATKRKPLVRRIYPSTWLAMLLAAGVMFVVEYPGRRGFDLQLNHPTYRHGWPLPWVEGPDGGEYGARWGGTHPIANGPGPVVDTTLDENEERRNPWSLHDRTSAFDLARLVVDIGISLILILLVGWGFQLWRRRHGSLARYRLRTLLGFAALFALIVSPVASWHREWQREREIIEGLKRECVSGLVPSYAEALYNNGDRIVGKELVAGIEVGTKWAPPALLPDSLAKIVLVRRMFDRVAWLGIHGDQFTEQTIAPLGDLAHLEALNVAKGNFTPAGFQAVLRLTNLKTLRLHEAKITDQQLDQLCNLAHLEFLELGNAQITDDGMAALSRLHNLGCLWITSHLISGKSFGCLKSCQPLTGLVVEADGLTEEGIASIGQLQHLGGIELRKTRLESLALQQLVGLTDLSLRENMGLTSVDLRRLPPLQYLTIDSTSTNGQIAHPALSLCDLKATQELRINGAILDPAALSAIGDAPQIWTLDLRNIRLTDSSSLKIDKEVGTMNISIRDSDFADISVEGGDRVSFVRISSNPRLTTIRLVQLPRLESVEVADDPRLDLAKGLLSDLALLPRLQKLTLNCAQLCDRDLALLKPGEGLRSLDLSRCNITGEGLIHLRGLTPLCDVDLRKTPVSDEAVAALQNAIVGLSVKFEPKKPVVQDLRRQVALVQNRLAKGIACKTDPWKLADGDFACLEGLANLQTLDVSDTHLTDAGLKHLARLPKLRELILRRTLVSDAGVRTLKEMPALVHVDIDGTRITAEGRRALGKLARGRDAERK